MSDQRSYGEFPVNGGLHDSLDMCWWLRPDRLEHDWKDVSEVANFIADYLAASAASTDELVLRQLRDSASYVVNELVENAVKYCADDFIQASSGADDDHWTFAISHGSPAETVAGLEEFLERLQASSAEELMIEQVERNFELGSESGSGLGLVTIIADHGAIMAWQIVPNGGRCMVHTAARLPTKPTFCDWNGAG
ncbi:MAG: hypothetical protein AAGE01_04035 [Pseudomonadota bacterium]